ncbi:lon-related putative ATP-dependent protease [Alkalithermobacter thermoalcaliphilus JW-YL-7 = DSM 7308]|uniref:endopeptidase La n=1 Tax=Alkalithermobacter thermoalcaliphilus JW-YL-7 = DSM 7308 TaxID=1121328 RepID=A0A150FTY2_CLOPD|nr:peptidase S16 lon domain protein [[Clostridium] paradoxum JW-YL-7 = DSM 7308]SHK72779.1 lon-related putative ATP-dependent protease [[Clostridium] paradoxum JW-YL-7 = DSM 7308]
MVDKYKVAVEDLKCKCTIEDLDFKATDNLDPLKGIIGQERAVEALNFGLKIKKTGYNIYVSGISGTGRTSYTNSLVEEIAKDKTSNYDWVYVYNFKSPDEPIALSFESGKGKQFKKDVEDIAQKLQVEIPNAFESKEYETENRQIVENFEKMSYSLVEELNDFAKSRGFIFQQTSRGLFSVPLKPDGSPMSDEDYKALSEDELEKIRERSSELSKDITDYINKIKILDEKFQDKIKELDKQTGERVVSFYIQNLLEKYSNSDKVKKYISDLKEDIIENISKFKRKDDEGQKNLFSFLQKDDTKFFLRYKVNLFIDNSDLKGAPIVTETNPTYYNLTGMIEYKNEIGVLTTNFLELKPGALHKANGGFLILNVKDVFSHPFAWEGLKRSLKCSTVTIESLNKQYGYIVTSTLKPEPIDLDVKVILIGDPYTYSLLYHYDEDFRKLFKIMADFDIEIDKNKENIYKLAMFVASHCEKVGLKHFDKSAVEKIIEYSLRISENKNKLSARFNQIVEILYEADALSRETEKYVTAKDVQRAIDARIYRNNKYEQKLNEMFEDGTLLIDIDGEKVGQINGLAVIGTGQHTFGKPSRITASTYKGKAGIINIEREIKHSGSIHDKGVLILSGYLGEKYAKERALSLTTSITFEQNYSGIDGDSASSTELYVIISSIAQIPIKQYIAVTGSISQKGEIQPIGGVNEKIEGFFDICKLKGLTGKQGVIIPKQNVKNLMLKDEIIEAVKEGKFHIYAIGHVNEGLEILTGMSIDEIDKKVNEALDKFHEEDEDKKEDKKGRI